VSANVVAGSIWRPEGPKNVVVRQIWEPEGPEKVIVSLLKPETEAGKLVEVEIRSLYALRVIIRIHKQED
jgi:hypothetical protein